MRTTLLMAGTLALGLLIYWLLVFDRADSTLDPGQADFSIPDTAEVQRIVMSVYQGDRMVDQVTLHRVDRAEWEVNGRYPALLARVQYLLTVMSRLSVREVLNDAGERNANHFFEAIRTEVEIMDADGRYLKHYFVGSETPDARGTLMRMADSETPYVIEMPGLQGYVKASFVVEQDLWRANRLFLADTSRLASLDVQFPKQAAQSWTLTRAQAGQWDLAQGTADPERLNACLARFKGMVYAETFAAADFPGRKQPLEAQTPDVRLLAQYRNGDTREVVLYDRDDNPNNLFGWVVGEDELLTIQHFVIDPYLPSRDYLTGESDDRATPLEGT
jgi:hypothetical protein